MSEASNLFNLGGSNRESLEYGTNISSWLHGDNTKLIFFVHPDKECLVVVMEDATSFRPFIVATGCCKEPVSFLKEEVVGDELVSVSFT